MKKYFKDILDVYGIKKDFITAFLLDFIIIYIDVKNLFSIIHKNNYISLLILFLLIIITSFLNTKEIKLLISKSINHIDSLIITFFISLIGLLINQFLTEIVFYKLILIIIFILLNIILFIIRIKCINKTISQGYNVYDLKYLCDNPIDISSGGILLLEEKEVYYDLLNRNRIINQLYNVIIRCSPKETFTIGLQGAWGDGKTTIINNVISLIEKNRLMQNFVIVKFNPWDYDNEKAMLKGIIDRVLNEINLSSKLENIEELIDNLIDIVFYNGKNNIGSIFKISKNDIASKTKIENLVNKYLKNHNKKLLLIIDNMDRINTSKINFLLKCSASIINFEQTILVLSYDEKIIETKLDKKFGTKGKKFLDKIIQLKIDVPKIDFKCLEIIKNKLSNNITYNGEQILKNIFTSHLIFDSIRELKIFLNGFFISVGDGDSLNCLNIADMVKLDFIKSKNAELYYDIFENKDYYIIDDRHYEKEIFSINYDDLNKRAKNYFSKLFSNKKNEEFKEILIELFPSVKNYFNKLKIFDIDNRDKIEYYNGITEYKIYNARYFDLYFTKTENEFIWINKEVDKIIKLINTQSIKNFEQKIIEITNKFEFDELKLYMEIFELKINNINKNKKLDVLLSLLKNKNRFHDRILFIGLDSMKRCEIIISKIITQLNAEEFLIFYNSINSDYRNLYTLEEIDFWLNNNTSLNNTYTEEIRNLYKKMCNDIIEKNIDIYSDRNYGYLNLWTLFRYDEEKIVNYLNKVLNSNNIFRFLKDLVTRSNGTGGYGYSISQKNIEILSKREKIDELINKSKKSLSEDEKLLIEIYEKSKVENEIHDNSIYTNEFIEFKKI